jgi:hypothetical protein
MNPLIVAGQRLGKKRYRGNKYTRNNRRIVGPVAFYALRVVSQEIWQLVLPRISFCISDFIKIIPNHFFSRNNS